ncbi:uncharacterized protein TNCV_5033991 [Trichonephila clavipes]|nr:uncharacterized protein TNCV_5033991 [Trichonephila clavipes]
MFGARWIECGKPVPWRPRSPVLWSFDYFLWGHLKNIVYAIPFDSDEDIIARISEATARVREIPDIHECVRRLLHRRCQACIAASGRNFEQLCKHYTCRRHFQYTLCLSFRLLFFLCVCASRVT